MTTATEYQLIDRVVLGAQGYVGGILIDRGRVGGILIDPDNGTPEQHLELLKDRYGARLLLARRNGQTIYQSKFYMREACHA